MAEHPHGAIVIEHTNRGLLAVVAALAIVLAMFAAISGPYWFDRDRPGFSDPALGAGVLGVLTLALVPLRIALIAFAARGFSQRWGVEVQRRA